jgi:hypothetical protein
MPSAPTRFSRLRELAVQMAQKNSIVPAETGIEAQAATAVEISDGAPIAIATSDR